MNIFRLLHTKYRIRNTVLHTASRGVATLPTVMVMGVMALAVAVGITAVALNESFISQGSGQSARALFYAEAGARDALLKIARNKNYATSSYPIYFSADLTACTTGNNGCALVSVATTTTTTSIATSTGYMKAAQRTVVVGITLAPDDYGAIASTTWSEPVN